MQASPATVAQAIGLPSARKCVSRRKFPIRLKQPAGVPLASAVVHVGKTKIRTRKVAGRFVASIDLRKFPAGRFTVTIRAVTVTGRKIVGKRSYKTCAPRRSNTNTGPL